MRLSMKRAGAWALTLVLSTLVGCTQKMALNPAMTSLDTHEKSVAIFTLVIKNDFKPDYGVMPRTVKVQSSQGGDTEFECAGDWQGNGTFWNMTWTGTSEFPVSMALAPGKYTAANVVGGGTNMILMWKYDFPINREFDVPPGSVVYLGHVVMTNRERKEGEPRSGSMFALIDQGVAGMSGGTTDVTVTDNSSEDIPKFMQKYPCLKGMNIVSAVMASKM